MRPEADASGGSAFQARAKQRKSIDLLENTKTSPGDSATAEQMLRLAEEYRSAAQLLMSLEQRGDSLLRAPCRLAAIHSIELYLSALLLHAGEEPSSIRRMQHDLSARTELAATRGLLLKKRTTAHLSTMTENREYFVTRYGPEMAAAISQINRLEATLKEVANKVTTRMKAAR